MIGTLQSLLLAKQNWFWVISYKYFRSTLVMNGKGVGEGTVIVGSVLIRPCSA